VDFFVKPVPPERLVVSLRNAIKLETLETLLRSEQHRRGGTLTPADLVTRAPAMERVLALCRKAAKAPVAALIEGEAGTGKELVARILHGLGERATKPFLAVNCASLAAEEIEAALFGRRHAGADDRPGAVAEANGGTLFLDEIGALGSGAQRRLLRVLERGEVEPVGATRAERVQVRVTCATSRRLLGLAQAGAFREDLYYRLNVMPIYLPPLRERREDIALLAGHFLARFAAEAQKRVTALAPEALELLAGYDWPGNVRELENLLYRAVILSEGDRLEAADFPQIVAQLRGRQEMLRLTEAMRLPSAPVHIDAARPVRETAAPGAPPDRFLDASGEVAPLPVLERELIAFALQHYGGRMSKVARALGIGRSTLYRKLREYGLEGSAERDAA
jgi:DNA-binding NtrC family response regulator